MSKKWRLDVLDLEDVREESFCLTPLSCNTLFDIPSVEEIRKKFLLGSKNDHREIRSLGIVISHDAQKLRNKILFDLGGEATA